MTPTPNPDANSMLQFWLVLGLVSFVISNVVLIISALARRKQRREVSFEFTPASKEEFDKHVDWNQHEHVSIFAKIGGVERGSIARMESLGKEWRGIVDSKMAELLTANNQARENLHRRINNQSRMLYLVCGKMGIDVAKNGGDEE